VVRRTYRIYCPVPLRYQWLSTATGGPCRCPRSAGFELLPPRRARSRAPCAASLVHFISHIVPRDVDSTGLFFNLLLSLSRHPFSEYKNEHFLSAIMSTHSGICERRLGLAGYQNRALTDSRAVEFATADIRGQCSSSVSALLSGEARLLGSGPDHGLV
jgi:hypothetical protein